MVQASSIKAGDPAVPLHSPTMSLSAIVPLETARTRSRRKRAASVASATARRYFEESSVHGLKYLVEGGRPWREKAFWLVSLAGWWTAAAISIWMVSA